MRILKTLLIFAASGGASLFSPSAASLAQGQQDTTVTGTIIQTWGGSGTLRDSRGYPEILPVRLCSTERVLETHSDTVGQFTFSHVPPGVYQLSTGRQVTPPRTIRGIEFKAGETPAPLLLDLNDTEIMKMETADCFRDTYPPMDCEPAWFSIEYRAPFAGQKDALLSGRVTDRDRKRSIGLGNAKVSLTKVGDANVHYSAVSDKQGFFQFTPPAGVYDLTASLEGFQDVKINNFLVPRENNTKVTLLTRSNKTIVVCQ